MNQSGRHLALRIILMMLLIPLLAVFGLVSTVMLSFGIRYPYLNYFFMNFFWIVPTLIGMHAFALLFLRIRKRLVWLVTAFLLVVFAIAGGAVYGYDRHIENLRVAERGINLYDFEPFRNNTELARLDHPASLALSGTLPKLDGATALYPVYASFVEAVYPEGEYSPYGNTVACSKTHSAYERLIEGEVDIIFAGPPSSEQMAYAERSGVELTLTPIGYEAFVFFVNQDNPVETLTVEEVIGIYSGSITRWNEVGGHNASIEAFQRPPGSGSQTALLNMMGDTPLSVPPKELVVGSMGGIISTTADYRNHRNSIGFSFRYFSMHLVQNESVKHIALNGVYPSSETIIDGSYPGAAPFYAITAGSENPQVPLLIDWILSEEGQTLIDRSGYVPYAASSP